MGKNRDTPNNTPSQEDFLLFGYKGLVIAMLKLMMKDLTIPDSKIQVNPHDSRKVREQKRKKEFYKRSAYCFVMSEWFDDLCFLLGINPHPIRRYALDCYEEVKKK